MAEIRLELPEGYVVRATDSPDSPLVERFFAGYDRAFILPDEREELSGFRECLALNESALATAFGRRHREVVAILEAPAGEFLGGANFFSVRRSDGALGPQVSANLNYVFVERAARGRGILRRLLDATHALANRVHGLSTEAAAPAIFIEQNDPLRLSEVQYAEDTAHSGTDQIERLGIWAHLGARLVDHAYVQPALTLERCPEEGLLYAALFFPGVCVPAGYLHDHLQSFFGVSVLKGRLLESDRAASSQLRDLAASSACIDLLPFSDAVRELRTASERPDGAGFLEFLRGRTR